MRIDKEQNKNFGDRRWIKMINSLSGFKSANLLGTRSAAGISNLSMISSVVHLGANPPLMAMILRPHSEKSPRHSLINLLETGFFTLNHVHEQIYVRAHQCSARFPQEVSEFDSCGLSEQYLDSFPAPFVAEAKVKIAMKFINKIDLSENGTHLIIGEIQFFEFPDAVLRKDGYIDIEAAGSLAVSSLDSYHRSHRLQRLSYAKPDRPVESLSLDGESLGEPELS